MLTFEALALTCAPAIALDLLVGIAIVESGIDPLAVIASGKPEIVQTVGHGLAAVVSVTD